MKACPSTVVALAAITEGFVNKYLQTGQQLLLNQQEQLVRACLDTVVAPAAIAGCFVDVLLQPR